jgi:2-phosphoglycerate kinase
MRPLVVLVSGAPGSGKSTLAAKVAAYMRVPHIERDNFTRGMELTLGREVNRVKESFPLYYRHLAAFLDDKVSLVTDGTLYKGASEADVRQHLASRAFVVNIHTRARDEHQRFYDREMNREGHAHDWVQDHMKVLEGIYDDVVNPLDLGVPLIEVDTNDGYDPEIARVVEQIYTLYEKDKG